MSRSVLPAAAPSRIQTLLTPNRFTFSHCRRAANHAS
jgi:hypothetical protein